jgi:hypothetical protein
MRFDEPALARFASASKAGLLQRLTVQETTPHQNQANLEHHRSVDSETGPMPNHQARV